VLCLGPAGAPDALVPAFDGPRLLELGLDGAVLGEASLEAPKARVRNAVIGGVQEDGAVLVLATLLLREQRSECLLYTLAPGRSSLLARWPAAPMPAIECPWSAKAEAAAKGEVTRAIGPVSRTAPATGGRSPSALPTRPRPGRRADLRAGAVSSRGPYPLDQGMSAR
jgi:hypothetical protein